MSWLQTWRDWLDFDNGRSGTASPLLNKDCIDSMVGVLMMGTEPSWYTQPLNVVNLYGYGRLAWNSSLTKEEIYSEWIGMTFATIADGSKTATIAAVHEILVASESIATELGIYHGYRGVWVRSLMRPALTQVLMRFLGFLQSPALLAALVPPFFLMADGLAVSLCDSTVRARGRRQLSLAQFRQARPCCK